MRNKVFFTGIEIPEQQIQDVQITHVKIPKGSHVTIVSMRNAIFDGRNAAYVIADKEYHTHELSYNGGVWMTDSLQEIEQCKELVQDFRGRVLVGGLGLGVVLHYLPKSVKQTRVIERDERIVTMVWPYVMHSNRDEQIKVCDLFDYVKTIKKNEFDYAFLDIWQPTGEDALITHVLPLRVLLQDKIRQDRIRCWGESEMWGQVEHGLTGWLTLKFNTDWQGGDAASWAEHDKVKAPYLRWFLREQPTEQRALRMVRDFVKHPLQWFERERIDVLQLKHEG